MSTETYAIVFKGEIVEGFEAAAVQAQLAKLLKLDPAKAKAWLMRSSLLDSVRKEDTIE